MKLHGHKHCTKQEIWTMHTSDTSAKLSDDESWAFSLWREHCAGQMIAIIQNGESTSLCCHAWYLSQHICTLWKCFLNVVRLLHVLPHSRQSSSNRMSAEVSLCSLDDCEGYVAVIKVITTSMCIHIQELVQWNSTLTPTNKPLPGDAINPSIGRFAHWNESFFHNTSTISEQETDSYQKIYRQTNLLFMFPCSGTWAELLST